MVRPEGFEPPASWFVARRSIQLSYGRNEKIVCNLLDDEPSTPAPKLLGRLKTRTTTASGARILTQRLPITIPVG
jgi:hypothetical protein